mmetsp:Transcript_11054/g.17699  ORF Transcript_11054/g.17699 Transcript_11054/m.17699 type:complete len:257 (+) Transcript_11054:437-1207(+)
MITAKAAKDVDLGFERVPLKRTSTYQLSNLAKCHTRIADTIGHSIVLPRCDDTTGWFPRDLFARIKEYLNKRLEALLAEPSPPPALEAPPRLSSEESGWNDNNATSSSSSLQRRSIAGGRSKKREKQKAAAESLRPEDLDEEGGGARQENDNRDAESVAAEEEKDGDDEEEEEEEEEESEMESEEDNAFGDDHTDIKRSLESLIGGMRAGGSMQDMHKANRLLQTLLEKGKDTQELGTGQVEEEEEEEEEEGKEEK